MPKGTKDGEKSLAERRAELAEKAAKQKESLEAVQRKLSADFAKANKTLEVAKTFLAAKGKSRKGLYDEATEREFKALQEQVYREEALERSVMSAAVASKAADSGEIAGTPVRDESTDTLGSGSEVGDLSSTRGGVAPSEVAIELADLKPEVVGGRLEAELEPKAWGSEEIIGSSVKAGGLSSSRPDSLELIVSEDEAPSRSRSVSSASVAEDEFLEVDDNVSEYGSVRSRISSVGSEDNLFDLDLEEENAEEYYSAAELQKLFQPVIELLKKSGNNKEVAEQLIEEINEFVENADVDSLDSLKEKLKKAQEGAKSPWGGTSHFKPAIEKALSAIGQIQNEEGIGDYAHLDASTGSDAGRESVDGEVRGQDMIFSSAAEDPKLKGKSSNAASRESDSSSWGADEDDPIMSAYQGFADTKKRLLQNAIEGLKDEDIHKIHNDQKSIKTASDNKGILKHSNSYDISFHKDIAAKFTPPKYPNGFRPVGWDQSQATESKEVTKRKSQIFGNDDLVEKTKTTRVNGRDMKARTCNFPYEIKAGTGPLHLSIILKDENGKNMEKSKAVYFSAHYDSQGELKEMTYPIPIQFDQKSGQGFFIRDDKTYTLPIDKNTFERMQVQMDVNRSNTREASVEELGDDLIRQAGIKYAANQLRSRFDSSFSAEGVGGGKLVASSLTVEGSDKGLSHSSSSKPSSSKDAFFVHDSEESSFRERSGSLSKEPGPSSIGSSEPKYRAISSSSKLEVGVLARSKESESSFVAASGFLEVGLGDDGVKSLADSLKRSLSYSSSSPTSSLPMVQPKAPDSFQVPEAEDKKKVKIREKEFDCYTYNNVNVYIDNGHVYEVPSKVAEKTGFKAIHSEANKAYQEFLKPKKKDGASK